LGASCLRGVLEGRVGRGLGMESGGSVRLRPRVALGDSFSAAPEPEPEPVPVPERGRCSSAGDRCR
jgi:hypothetical protein